MTSPSPISNEQKMDAEEEHSNKKQREKKNIRLSNRRLSQKFLASDEILTQNVSTIEKAYDHVYFMKKYTYIKYKTIYIS